MSPAIDPITTEVIGNLLMAAAEEMGATLIKAAYSPNIKGRADCSTAVFDRHGQVVAQAHRIPIHLGSMLGLLEEVLKRFPLTAMRPGDMFLANDPYTGGGQHLPDISTLSPVFHGGKIVAFVASLGHHSDVGGMVAGSESSDCRSIFQEGLRIPPVKIFVEGALQEDILNIILLNTRTPWERRGDLQAQFAANQVGLRGMQEILARYGAAVVLEAMDELLRYAERRVRAGIAGIPDGRYTHVDYLDGDGVGDEPLKIALAVAVHGGELHLDFTGTAPQGQGSKNATLGSLLATVYTVVKSMIDPDLPANSGYFRAIRVTAPPGCLVNAQPPAAVASRVYVSAVVGDVIVGALSKALPHRAMAGSGPSHLVIPSGLDPRRGAFFVNYEGLAGALGARPYRDGLDAVRVHASGGSNLPVEAVENNFPLLVERYELREDSGGAGKYRGGLGIRRHYRIPVPGLRLVANSERQRIAAPGLFGGHDGAPGRFVLNPGTPEERILPPVLSDFPLEQGDLLRIETPGGAGCGDPLERDPALVLRDVQEGRVSLARARSEYGVVITNGRLDLAETERIRRDFQR
jgi:N-methylhydantoinase B